MVLVPFTQLPVIELTDADETSVLLSSSCGAFTDSVSLQYHVASLRRQDVYDCT